MNQKEWIQKIMLSSIPLGLVVSNGQYRASTGCIIRYRNKRILLTAAHNFYNKGDMYIICDLNRNKISVDCIKHPLNGMNFLTNKIPSSEEKKCWDSGDIAYKTIPEGVKILHQRDNIGAIKKKMFKIDLASDLNITPDASRKYGFYGMAIEPRYSISPSMEIDMRFLDSYKEDGYVFKLNRKRQGHDYYRRCSGAPILDDNGNLVSLVIQGSDDNEYIYGISLAKYREIIGT